MGLMNFAMQTRDTNECASIENVLLLALVGLAFAGLAIHFGMGWQELVAAIQDKLHFAARAL
jgi:hypothetical protein